MCLQGNTLGFLHVCSYRLLGFGLYRSRVWILIKKTYKKQHFTHLDTFCDK